MKENVIVQCADCNEKYYFANLEDKMLNNSVCKAPCPNCNSCALTKEQEDNIQIKSSHSAADIFERISDTGR